MYDIMVANRNQKLILDAARSNAMVSQLFPAGMANKMIHRSNKQQTEQAQDIWKNSGPDGTGNSHNLQSTSKVLADLYLEASVSFADITGFTAWSSVRSPDQVFELLETVYRHFDDIAKRRGIFKVETVGDCYVSSKPQEELLPGLPKILGTDRCFLFFCSIRLLPPGCLSQEVIML